MRTNVQFKTTSEELFAAYLDDAKYSWDYEPTILGQTKKPDFVICHSGGELLSDVKERAPTHWPAGAHNINPLPRVRELINKGIKKFKGFDKHTCALVVYNNGDFQTRLDPFIIYGAMLGDPGFTFSFANADGIIDDEPPQNVFLQRRGRMIRHYKPLDVYDSPRNLSAVIALHTYRVPNPAFEVAQAEEERRLSKELGRPLTSDEKFGIAYHLICDWRATLGEAQRVTVCLNPFARHELPAHIFNGEYDERWAMIDGAMTRVYVGAKRLAEDDD